MSKMLEGVFLLVVIVGLFEIPPDRANLFSTPTVLSGLIHFLSPSPYGGEELHCLLGTMTFQSGVTG